MHRSTPSLLRFSTCAIGALFAMCALQTVFAAFEENFDFAPAGRSLYARGGQWIKFGKGDTTQPDANKATLGDEAGRRFVSLLAVGDDTVNGRATARVSLPVSDTENSRISAALRLVTPGSAVDRLTTMNVAISAYRSGRYDAASGLSFGILASPGGASFFIDFGAGNRLTSNPRAVTLKPDAWYRFDIRLTPSQGTAIFRVFDESVAGSPAVWEGTNAGLPAFAPEEFVTLNFMVARPGRDPQLTRSADFGAISLTP